MKKNIEIEFKFQVLDEHQIKNFLKTLDFISKKRIVDVYLDTKDIDLYKRGVFIRVRNGKRLDLKYNLEDNKHEECEEHSFSLPLEKDMVNPINKICEALSLMKISKPSLEELKIKNRLINSVIIDKVRQEFTDGRFKISFDAVKDIGNFIEIEFLGSEKDNSEEIKNEMREKIKNLNLKLITTGYNELYWRKHDFNVYLQGKYLLEDDKKCQQ